VINQLIFNFVSQHNAKTNILVHTFTLILDLRPFRKNGH